MPKMLIWALTLTVCVPEPYRGDRTESSQWGTKRLEEHVTRVRVVCKGKHMFEVENRIVQQALVYSWSKRRWSCETQME